jgi:iron complex outermembrane receptor protein
MSNSILRHFATLMGVAFMLLAPAPSAAQGPSLPTLTGRLTDESGIAVRDALVTIADAGGRTQTTRSNEEGRYVFALPGRGRYTLRVRSLGFQPMSRAVDLPAEGLAVDLTLRKSSVLQPVEVIGAGGMNVGAEIERSTPSSVLGGDQVAREQVAFAQEVLRKLPGVYRAEFNQGIISGDIGIRGFNAESEIGSTKLLIDGIPSNMNSGIGEMNAIFPLEIEEMEVVRGTSDTRFGMFNLAGNVQLRTREGGNHLLSRITTGSFGTTEAQLLSAVSRGGFSQTLFGGLRQSQGFRDQSALEKWSGSGKWSWTTSDARWRAALIVRQHELDTDAPGYLTREQSQTQPTFSPAFSATDGGTVGHKHASLHLDGPLGAARWSLKAYDQRFERTRFVRFTAAGAQQERIEDESQRGAIAQLTWRPAALASRDAVWSAGVDVQRQDNLQQRFRTADRVRQATLRDFDFSLDNRGGFTQLALDAAPGVRVTAGLRLDSFDGAFRNIATSTTTPILDFGLISQPKLGVLARLNDRVSAYGNYGRSFQIGAGVAAYGTQPLTWSKNDGYEVGITSRPSTTTSLRVGAWQQDASDEVRLRFDNSGDSENVGQTQRRGIDLEGTWQATSAVALWASGTTQRAILVEPGLTNPGARGKRLNHVPDWTAKYGVDYAPSEGWSLSAWAYAQGEYHLNQLNDRGTFGAQHVVNTDFSFRWRSTAVAIGVTNLFDRYIEYVWWDGAQTLHSPAAGRAMFLTLTLDR